MTTWEATNYQRIKMASESGDNLEVTFENGDIIVVPKDSLAYWPSQAIEWGSIKVEPYEVTVKSENEEFVIPWDKIRAISDREFSKHLAERAATQASKVGARLRILRERSGLKAYDLAERAGVTPQTISRIEQGHSDLSLTTLGKILGAMGYSFKDLAAIEKMEAVAFGGTKNLPLLIRRLSNAGVDTGLFLKKILPRRLQDALNTRTSEAPPLLLDEAASFASTIFGWSIRDIWGDQLLTIGDLPARQAFYKKPSNANENQVLAYSHYAFHLAKSVAKAHISKPITTYPSSLEEFVEGYSKSYPSLTLQSLLDFVWSLGICVLPLNDSGVFHGASWNIEGKHVIVLKQNTAFHSRWIFDLLHELYHVFAHLETQNTAIIELEEPSPFSSSDSIEELEANSFANKVVFGDRAEELAGICVEAADWKLENLKSVISEVSRREKIGEDFLSNYLAFRLANQGENWWGTAAKFQIIDPSPLSLANKALMKNIQLERLGQIDHSLLETAITQ